MEPAPALPRQVKAVDSMTLLGLERSAASHNLNQWLDIEWLAANTAAQGGHYLWPTLWNTHRHRTDPQPVRHLWCQLLLRLHTGEQVLSLLDMRFADFAPLPAVRSRAEGLQVARLLGSVPSVAWWQQEHPWPSQDGAT